MPAAGQHGPDLTSIRKLTEDCFESYLADLRSLVHLDCGTYIPQGVNRVADLMQERFAAR